jgi:hypothetical protein
MQTFLPYPDFARSAAALDDRRLGKQRSEVLQVLRAMRRPGYGWRHHPAVRMWRGYEPALASYGAAVCGEWTRRGHPDTCLPQILEEAGCPEPPAQGRLQAEGRLPPWLGDPGFHRSHQAALLRKDPERYRDLFPGVPAELPYVWPGEARADGQHRRRG